MTQQQAHYVVELVGQSHERNRSGLPNEDVITVPVVDGPYNSYRNAEIEVTEHERDNQPVAYGIVTVTEQDPDYLDVEITAQ
jgi:hypothetical protein